MFCIRYDKLVHLPGRVGKYQGMVWYMILFDDDQHWEHICLFALIVYCSFCSARLGNDINQHREDNDDDE